MTRRQTDTLSSQDLVETALSLAKADQTAVVVREQSEASLRWANSTMTTNGVSRSRSVSVVSVVGESVGTRTATVVGREELAELVCSRFPGHLSCRDDVLVEKGVRCA